MHAIVIGGSIAGLLAARVLSERCSRVTVLDRDVLPACGMNRRGVPQGWHGHGLLASGLQVLKDLFPGIEDELLMRGATAGDVARDAIWYQHGCYKARVDVGLRAVLLSRALLEGVIRQRVKELPGVDLIDSHPRGRPRHGPVADAGHRHPRPTRGAGRDRVPGCRSRRRRKRTREPRSGLAWRTRIRPPVGRGGEGRARLYDAYV